MATFYLDFVNGNNANTGASWAQALATVAGVTAGKGLAAGDTVRIAKTPDKVSLGNATWTTGPISTTTRNVQSVDISGSPIVITTVTAHGYSTGDVIQITNVLGTGSAVGAINGTFIITVTGSQTFSLDGSTAPGGSYTSGGTCTNVTPKAVKLATAQTKTVNNCNAVWTSANSATVTLGTANYNKEGYGFLDVTAPASAAANTRYAYFTLSTVAGIDFSAYQQLSFWFRSAGFTAATNWVVCLCSDTTGTTIVDTFLVPASGAQNNPNAVVLSRSGGGNLGSSIRSIAIYSGSVAANSSNVSFDNFIACTTNGLNLQCLLSPVASNTDQYDNYPIQSINENLVLLDNSNTTVSTAGRGYYGTTQTTTTYFRQPNNNTSLYSAIGNASNLITPAVLGTAAAPITWSGGWNTSTNLQDGMTVTITGGSNNAWQLTNYTYFENIGVTRGATSFRNSAGNYTYGWKISNCFGVAANTGAVNLAASVNNLNYPGQIQNSGFNNNNGGLQLNSGIIQVDTVKVNNCVPPLAGIAMTANANTSYVYNAEVNNTNTYGFGCSAGNGFTIKNWTSKDNLSGVITFNNAAGWTFYNGTTSGNPVIDTQNNASGDNFIIGLTSTSDGGPSAPNNGYGNTIYVNRNGTNITWYNQKGTTTVDTGTVHGSATSSWKFTNTGSVSGGNLVLNPQVINIATVYCYANQSTTVSAWFNKSHATDMQAALICPGGQIAGVTSDVVTNAANSTGWQQVSINFTPTASGVVTIQAEFWIASTSVANTGLNCFVSDLTLPTGVANQNLSYNFMGLPWAQNTAAPSVAYGAVGL